MKRLLVAVAATLLLALAGCSGESAATGPSTPTSPPSEAAAPDGSSPSASTSSPMLSDCLNGRYRLVRFVGVGEKGTYGTGQGGDVTVTFDNGSYRLRGAGKDPIKLTLAGQNAGLLVDGTIGGSYQLHGDRASFTVARAPALPRFRSVRRRSLCRYRRLPTCSPKKVRLVWPAPTMRSS